MLAIAFPEADYHRPWYLSPSVARAFIPLLQAQTLLHLRTEGLEAALRVDQAGEVAANYIYMGQMAVLGSDRRWAALSNHERAPSSTPSEADDPTPASTSRWEAAMACTEAVETVIGEHYDELDGLKTKHPSIPLLKSVIEEFRDDELEHLDTAVEHHSQRAPAHALLTAVVEAGCKGHPAVLDFSIYSAFALDDFG
ncbi:ubiquinone biosynthesis monooxygenase COQ7 [Rhizoctonia solani]|uniref:Ubiquinone biosynthesis monooxygenase COQ7 n=1 Tax=Rhizoctonia solani TaxID=456999 RepID=A0A8H8T393_9AGAM|nr:ubiquinone biosynthesis monooxygenase COQ7 [Rhizoctonia solani]QRW27644.1 ubiquinone biosynthesis monooxygenase COQ7 [Rhizoctonia solani]